MIHKANASFWQYYNSLPPELRRAADKQFALLKGNPNHASLKFKKIGVRFGKEIWSARVSVKYRALAFKEPQEYVWFWIGEHNVYDLIIK